MAELVSETLHLPELVIGGGGARAAFAAVAVVAAEASAVVRSSAARLRHCANPAPPHASASASASISERAPSLPAAAFSRAQRVISMAEVRRHASSFSCWLAIEGKVYDVTSFLAGGTHPGGDYTILRCAGLDATDAFLGYHPASVRAFLPAFYIGEVAAADAAAALTPAVVEYRELRERLEAEGQFETHAFFYVGHLVWIAAIFAGAIAMTVTYAAESWIGLLAGALLLGLFWQQVAFLGHDLGHNSVTHCRVADSAFGLVFGNMLTGIAISWWKQTHNAHHLATNSISHDPDIQHMPVIAISPLFFRSPFSWYHYRVLDFDAVARVAVTVQHWMFYPLMSVARWNLYSQSLQLLLTQKSVPHRAGQIAGVLFYFCWLSVLLLALPTFTQKFVFLYVSHAFVGLLHVQICLSHFSRPVFAGRPMDVKGVTFLHSQVAGTMDIDCWECLDWLHGGLQFQTIHHLFPRLPRHRLRALVPTVRALAERHGASYYMTDFWTANYELFDTLRQTAREASALHEGVWDALNASG